VVLELAPDGETRGNVQAEIAKAKPVQIRLYTTTWNHRTPLKCLAVQCQVWFPTTLINGSQCPKKTTEAQKTRLTTAVIAAMTPAPNKSKD